MPSGPTTRPPAGWQLARLLLAGSKRQAFLDHRWISWLLQASPPRYRRGLAQRILSLSPHYFIHQWDGYPHDWSRSRVLEAELERNRDSRREIVDGLLASAVNPGMSVLDFGCGPGFLAQNVRQRVQSVVAVDISSGTLACARALNPGPDYRQIRGSELPLDDASVDFVYSIAVFQHVDPSEWPSYFRAFARVLRPGGRGLCHFAIDDAQPVTYEEPGGLRGMYTLRFQESTTETVVDLLAGAGFTDIDVSPTREIASIDDDVGRQHVASFRKPG